MLLLNCVLSGEQFSRAHFRNADQDEAADVVPGDLENGGRHLWKHLCPPRVSNKLTGPHPVAKVHEKILEKIAEKKFENTV